MMRASKWINLCMVAALAGMLPIAAVAKPAAKKAQPLTPAGQKLQTHYAEQLAALRAEITDGLPAIDPSQAEAFMDAYRAESAAMVDELNAMRKQGHNKVKPADKQSYALAKAARVEATQDAAPVVAGMLDQLNAFLREDKHDATLARCVVLTEATPHGLASFAQQSKAHEALLATLLADPELMRQMLIAGGAKQGRYGRAMEIYSAIHKADPSLTPGVLKRLALAISLEHAAGIAQNNPKAQTDAPATVDPVKRYLHYKKAFQAGELDPCFSSLTTWEMRMVVHGNEPDWTLAWGREMLRNYRPDHVYTADDRWRYVMAVRTEVTYGSQHVKDDKPELQQYQNIIANGGVCGRRAFFGRFLLRAFGIPTVRRPQRGHAALTHWTPDGWVINLGAGWGWGWTPFGQDLDFRAHTRARADAESFGQVLRAKWLATSLGEKSAFGFHDKPGGFWGGVALYRQRQLNESPSPETKGAKATPPENPRKPKGADAKETITVSPDGTITLPAVACSQPTRSTRKVLFMDSFLGGRQLHYSQTGKAEDFEYTFDAPAAGPYQLTARVVTTSDNQHLKVTANRDETPTDIALPYTIGLWKTTEPVVVTLKAGPNVLRFSRDEPVKGLTIKTFTLRPDSTDRAETTTPWPDPDAQPADMTQPVKVFILAGQSNMVGHGKVERGRNPKWKKGAKGIPREIKGGIGCLRSLATDPKTAKDYEQFLGADGKIAVRDDVYVYSTAPGKEKGKLTTGFGKGGWFGPELGFGFEVGDALKEPVLIIKCAWGGKDLAVDFRPPSSGPTDLGKGKREPGAYYKKMMGIVKESLANFEKDFPELKGCKPVIAGFGWHQGWNDGCSDQATAEYETNMVNFINDVRKDLGVKDLPFVIANTGQNGTGTKGRFATLCEAQMAVGDPKKHPEFKSTVISIDTRPFKAKEERAVSGMGYHWNHSGESHFKVGESMGKAMVKLLKK